MSQEGGRLQRVCRSAAALFQFVLEFPHKHPQECLAEAFNQGGDSALYVDEQKKTLCLTVSVYERGKALCTYYVPETSDTWRTSELQTLINDLMTPLLAAQTQRAKQVKQD